MQELQALLQSVTSGPAASDVEAAAAMYHPPQTLDDNKSGVKCICRAMKPLKVM